MNNPKDYEDSHIRFGQGLVVAVCAGIALYVMGWAVFDAVMAYVGSMK